MNIFVIIIIKLEFNVMKIFMAKVSLINVIIIITFCLSSCSSSRFQEKDKSLLTKHLAVTIEPYTEIINDTTIIFGAKATRNYNLGNEILPSSEDFRVEVMELDKITQIWSSYKNKEFLAGNQKVEPQVIGESKDYKISWNRRNSKGVKIINDEVWVRIMIPSMPDFYIESYKVKLSK